MVANGTDRRTAVHGQYAAIEAAADNGGTLRPASGTVEYDPLRSKVDPKSCSAASP
jgi:hypothetical protein